jgi:hypothetical protein
VLFRSPAEVQSSIAVQFKAPAHRGECGAKSAKITIPFFLMGCCGDKDAVRHILVINTPQKINKNFFGTIAKNIKAFPFLDWDWYSFKKNILAPNREHIQIEMGLDDFFIRRVMEDGYVVINNWDPHSEEDEIQAIEDGFIPVSHRTFFTERNAEY